MSANEDRITSPEARRLQGRLFRGALLTFLGGLAVAVLVEIAWPRHGAGIAITVATTGVIQVMAIRIYRKRFPLVKP